MTPRVRSADRVTGPPADRQACVAHRFTVEQYHRMGAAGILTEDDRCELVRGLIVEKPVIRPPHKTALRRLTARLTAVVGPEYVLDSQGPVTLPDSEPEPDVTVAVGPDARYADRHPRPAELLLVVEVSDTSLEYDRGEKLQMYAAARVGVYWIVNIPDRRIEVYTQPRGGKRPAYRSQVDYTDGQEVPVVIAGEEVGRVAVADVLPEAT